MRRCEKLTKELPEANFLRQLNANVLRRSLDIVTNRTYHIRVTVYMNTPIGKVVRSKQFVFVISRRLLVRM